MDGVLRRESWGLRDMHQSDSGRKLMPLKDSQRWPSSLKKGTPVSQPRVRHRQLIARGVGVGRFSSSCPLGGWWLLISRGSHGTRCNWPQRRVLWPSQVALMVKEPACQCRMPEMWFGSLGWGDPLKEVMGTHSSILAWRIPMDRVAWQATVQRIAESWTRLKQLIRYIILPWWFRP